MSLAQRTITARLRFRDNDGAESTCDSNVLSSVSPDDAIDFLLALAPLVQAISSATLVSCDVIIRYTDSTPGSPDIGSDVNYQGTLIFNTASLDLATVRIPSLDTAYLETTGPFAFIRIDQTITAIQDLIVALADGLSSVEACDPFASDLVSINVAYAEQF